MTKWQITTWPLTRCLLAAALAGSVGIGLAYGDTNAAGVQGAPSEAIKGEVLEVKDAGPYTYLRLKTASGEQWAAVQRTSIAKGAKVTINDALLMKDFESRTLNRKFDQIALGTLAGAPATPAAAAPPASPAAANAPAAAAGANPHTSVVGTGAADVKVAKASGADARTVAEIVGKRAALKDKPVVVRGKVVKYTPDVMGKNWIHLRDGSGSATDRTNDVLITTAAQTSVGDVVTAKGVVRTDRDFGSGYAYQVLVEDATLQK